MSDTLSSSDSWSCQLLNPLLWAAVLSAGHSVCSECLCPMMSPAQSLLPTWSCLSLLSWPHLHASWPASPPPPHAACELIPQPTQSQPLCFILSTGRMKSQVLAVSTAALPPPRTWGPAQEYFSSMASFPKILCEFCLLPSKILFVQEKTENLQQVNDFVLMKETQEDGPRLPPRPGGLGHTGSCLLQGALLTGPMDRSHLPGMIAGVCGDSSTPTSSTSSSPAPLQPSPLPYMSFCPFCGSASVA